MSNYPNIAEDFLLVFRLASQLMTIRVSEDIVLGVISINRMTSAIFVGVLLKKQQDNLKKEKVSLKTLGKGINECKKERINNVQSIFFLPAIFIPAELLNKLYDLMTFFDLSSIYFMCAYMLFILHLVAFIRLILLIKIHYLGHFNIKTKKASSSAAQILNNYLNKINKLYYKPKIIKKHVKLVLKGVMKILACVFIGLIVIIYDI